MSLDPEDNEYIDPEPWRLIHFGVENLLHLRMGDKIAKAKMAPLWACSHVGI